MQKDDIRISKFLSFILRHHPEKFGLEIDSKGFADLNKVLKVVNQKYNDTRITVRDIERIIQNSNKKRFEIVEDKIRAFYGHSIDKKIVMNEQSSLPLKLYHGTDLNAYKKIQKEGLKKKRRQYVHLSDSIETAFNVGRRRTPHPIIIVIDINEAVKEGIKFYKSGDMYLVDYVPPRFISQFTQNKE